MDKVILKAVVVEDEQWIRSHIVGKIKKVCPECVIVGEADNGYDALRLLEKDRPDVVFTDIKMPGIDGLELARQIREQYPSIAVVIISGYSDFKFAQQAIQFGVFSYLLKPLEDDKLKDSFQDILTALYDRRSRKNRSILLPGHTARGEVSRDMLAAGQYHIYLLCFGNLCNSEAGEKYESYLGSYFEKIDWDRTLDFGHSNYGWLLVDELAVNQKCLMLPTTDMAGRNPLMFAHSLQEKLFDILPVNICCSGGDVNHNDIWASVQQMRYVMQNHVVLCTPLLLSIDQKVQPDIQELFNAARLRMEGMIRTAVHTMDFTKLQAGLLEILRYAEENQFTQKLYEKILMQAIHILEFSMGDYNKDKAEALQTQLRWQLCISSRYSDIERAFFDCVDNYLLRQKSTLNKEDILETIMQFVDANYTSIDSVENVATIFNYNYTYLSRVFKQHTGKSMSKYIMDKRMETAKRLIEFNPDLSIRYVSESVGYDDQHYFSRVFKQVCGTSPREYKINIMKRKTVDS